MYVARNLRGVGSFHRSLRLVLVGYAPRIEQRLVGSGGHTVFHDLADDSVGVAPQEVRRVDRETSSYGVFDRTVGVGNLQAA